MSAGYMGHTSICRDFVKTKMADDDCNDCNISCSICGTRLMNERDTILFVNSIKSVLQCIRCYSKNAGIVPDIIQLQSPPPSTPVTPAAPRARSTSDVSEIGCGEDAANAIASFSSVFEVMDQQQQQQHNPNSSSFSCNANL